MMETLDAKAIRALVAVARIGSIRGAAEYLSVAPSVVSRQVADTERNLGMPLFERTARGVILTEAGELVLQHGRRVVEDEAALQEQLNLLRGMQQGKITLLCGEGFLNDLIQHALQSFVAVYPQASFVIHSGSTEQIIDAVANGDADIGIAYNAASDVRIKSIAVARQPLCVVAPTMHRILQQWKPRLLDCLDNPIALLVRSSGVTRLIERVATDGDVALAPVLETSSIETLRRFVVAGLGITFLPRFAIASELEQGVLEAVELADPTLSQASAHLVVRTRRRLPKSVADFSEHLATEMMAFRTEDPRGRTSSRGSR